MRRLLKLAEAGSQTIRRLLHKERDVKLVAQLVAVNRPSFPPAAVARSSAFLRLVQRPANDLAHDCYSRIFEWVHAHGS
jgi:hypothetical protein